MKQISGILLMLHLAFFLVGCNGTPEITPEERQKQQFLQNQYQLSESALDKKDFAKAIEILKKASKRYPKEAMPYKKIAETARKQYQMKESQNEIESTPYLTALEQSQEYYKSLDTKKNEKGVKEALVFLGKILEEAFASMPIKKYQEALNIAFDMANLLENSPLKEAKYYLGNYYLYSYRLRKAAQYLKASSMIEANDSLNLIETLQKGEPESEVGKKLVFRKVLRRGDGAALFFHEMKDYELKEENRIPGGKYTPGMQVRDIQKFWARTEVEYCLRLGVMRLLGAQVFQPFIPLERIEATIMITNSLMVGKGDLRMLEKFRAKPNPFKDTVSDFGTDEFDETNVPYAICAMEQGYFAVGNDKKFYPRMGLKGIECMEILDKLKKELKKKSS